jgi:hypothetical protein
MSAHFNPACAADGGSSTSRQQDQPEHYYDDTAVDATMKDNSVAQQLEGSLNGAAYYHHTAAPTAAPTPSQILTQARK